jgi:hypothetical protein
MSDAPIRIAMWSGPRNISTALMRSFDARLDTVVIDEPFYAAYLARSGLDHPMRKEVLASQPQDADEVVATLLAPIPAGKSICYQKHMTHHMLEGFSRDWLPQMRNAFLIRDPGAVLASYVQKRTDVTLADIGVTVQCALFDREAQRLGEPPPVIDGEDILRNPVGTLTRLCAALGIAYSDAMLSWPAGRRATDGVWAPAWYAAVERSTGFAPPREAPPTPLPASLARVAEAAQPYYDLLAKHRLTA